MIAQSKRRIISQKGIFNSNSGLTLIEIILVLALLGLVTSVIFSLNLFGLRVFNKGNEKSQKQYEVRMAADFITKKLRYANSVTILNTTPTPITGVDYIYLDAANKIVYCKNGVIDINGLNGASDFTLVFQKSTTNPRVLKFTIGKTGDNSYDTNTEITVLNISSSGIVDATSSPRIGVQYSNSAIPTSTPSPSVSPSATPSSTTTPSPTPASTATPTPTPTIAPTATPNPSPTITPLSVSITNPNNSTTLTLTCNKNIQIGGSVVITNNTTGKTYTISIISEVITITFSGSVKNNDSLDVKVTANDGTSSAANYKYKNNGAW